MKRSALSAMLFASFTACRFLIDTDGLQGGAEKRDAAPQTMPTFDATTPVAPDASVRSDAQADVKMEAAPLPFCQARPGALFCTDFDVAGHNDGNDDGTDGTFSLDTAQSVSAPKSGLFVVSASNGASYRQLRKLVALPKSALKEIVLEFSLRPETKPEATTNAAHVYLIMRNGVQETGLIFEYTKEGMLHAYSYNKPDTNDAAGTNDKYYPKDFPADVNQWHTVKVTLTFGNMANGGAGGKYVATVDGKTETQDFPTLTNVGENFIYGGGIYNQAPFAEAKMRYDNIALNVSQ
jgi:hypothetical protein